MPEKSQLQVEAIKNGTVIDHIPAGQGLNILKRFHFLNTESRITIGFNLPSKALGSKDLIKVENFSVTEDQANQLALIAPAATVNIIKDFKVVEKRLLRLPEKITGVFECPNSNCITRVEPAATSEFTIINNHGNIQLKCKYCERVFDSDVVINEK